MPLPCLSPSCPGDDPLEEPPVPWLSAPGGVGVLITLPLVSVIVPSEWLIVPVEASYPYNPVGSIILNGLFLQSLTD